MHKLIYAFLLIICLSSFAFAEVRMNSLGDYFHYLVPDVETDIELFPTHLNFWEQRNIMLTAGDKYPSKKIGLNVYPLLGKISYGMKTGFASGEYPYRREYYPVIYLGDSYHFNPNVIITETTEPKGYKGYLSDSYEIGNRSGFYIKNFISLKIIDDCHIGIKFNWIKNWLTEDKYRIQNLLSYGYDYYNREYSEYRDLDDDSYSTGFNFCFGTNLRKDISVEYRKREYNDFEIDKRIFKKGYLDDSNKNYFDSNLSQNSYDLDSEEYRINILLEKKNNKRFWRLYLSSLYSFKDAISKYHNEDIDESYMNDTLKYAYWNYYNEGTTTESKYYQTVVGWGKNWISKKVQLFYGIKLQGSYEKITSDKYNQSKNIYYRYDSYNDTTTIDTTTYEDALPDIVEKYWQVTINLPLGMEYKLKDNLTLYCGLGYRISRRLVEYIGRDFYYWITDEYQSVGVEFKPIKNLELGLNLNGDLAYFKNWQVEVRYLF